MTILVDTIRNELRGLADPKKARNLQWFFKTGPGEYGEGDVFLGVIVPALRKVARKYGTLDCEGAEQLLRSSIHEERLLALLILVRQYDKGDDASRARIFRLYLANTKHINNWDLVDSSAPHIVGHHLMYRSRRRLYALAKSRSLWKRRIAIMATFYFIRQRDFDDTLKIADLLLADSHDLVHKAVGWAIREIGNRNLAAAETFLAERYRRMPRAMLRYAIEKFPEGKRLSYLRGEF